MVLWLIRVMFLLSVMASTWLFYISPGAQGLNITANQISFILVAPIAIGLILIMVDLIWRKKNLLALSGLFFGLLAGLVLANGIELVFTFIIDILGVNMDMTEKIPANAKALALISGLILMLLKAGCMYLCVSFVMQTKDDFRFIIPYVEFSRQLKGVHPILLDTSVLIDGRINDIVGTRILDCPLLVPRFVLSELHTLSDSANSLKRNRGRRGLDILKKLKANRDVDLTITSLRNEKVERAIGVDNKLVELALELEGRVMTTDFNLNKVAELRGVAVINLNELANTMKAIVLPGEQMRVKIIRAGEAAGQGVGFLEDGTMVVVDHGRDYIGQTIDIEITSMIQTSAGKMVFGQLGPDQYSKTNKSEDGNTAEDTK